MPASDRSAILDSILTTIEEIVFKLDMTADILHAEVKGISLPRHQPLVTLQAAGELDAVLAIIELLAERPELVSSVLQLASGSPLDLVARCMPG
jgi:hypothetical protein